jgi:hypothetical protein
MYGADADGETGILLLGWSGSVFVCPCGLGSHTSSTVVRSRKCLLVSAPDN